jgi:hypothetical protein
MRSRRSKEVEVNRTLRRDLTELQHLIRVLERHAPVNVADCGRELQLLDGHSSPSRVELHLRAVTALLVTLETYQQVTATGRGGHGRDTASGVTRESPAPAGINGAAVNGRPLNGHAGDRTPRSASQDTELAAATARYIARDLAARQLSEFTSAEGYRLARALARIGQVQAQVEQLLSEANKVRLHPMPLADAVSHSPH